MEQTREEWMDSVMKSYHYQKCQRLGATLLHYSARCGDHGLTDYLLRKGSDVNAKDSKGRTPLMMGIKGKDTEIVKALLAAGANILDIDYKGKSALSMLCANHRVPIALDKLFLREFRKQCFDSQDCAKKLIDAGCHLFQAAFINDAKIIEYMLEQGFPSNSMHPLLKRTALHIAIGADDLESFKLLLKYGANPHAIDYMNSNSLYYLYRYSPDHTVEKTEILKILLDLGVSATSCVSEAYDGMFQIRRTLENGNKDEVRLILQSKIDLKAKDTEGRTLLHGIANNRHVGIVGELKLHVDELEINAVDNLGLTPLHCAVFCGNVDMMTFLLDQGAKTNCALYSNGYTPLYYACAESNPDLKNEYVQCAELLLQHNADPQFICTQESGEQITAFDIAEIDRIKPIIAHLALLEELGAPITRISHSKIQSQGTYRKYFHRCRRILKRNISGTVTLFRLLASNERKISQYLNNKYLVLKLKRISNQPKIKIIFSYYYNTLEKHISKGIKCRILRNRAAAFFHRIFEDLCKTNLVIQKIIDYLNNEDLEKLCQA